mgnify:CR=1 FL=1
MLELLRRKVRSPLIQAALVIIILVFILYFGSYGSGSGPEVVATVNDQPISVRDYQQTYDRLVTQYREQFGGNLPENLLKSLGLKEQALNQLIEQALVQQGAREMGLAVSEEELQEAIREMSVFQSNGVFDYTRYEQVMSASPLSIGDFEASVRSDLLMRKVMGLLSGFGRVSPQELKERFEYEYQKVKLEYAALPADKFEDQVEIAPEKLAAYFEENQTRYQTEPQIKVKYISFPVAPAETSDIPPEKIESYYQENLKQYTSPEKRHARHILIKTAESDTAEEIAEKRQQAEAILAKVRAGEEFSALAKQYSDDSSASQGGDLGFFTRGQMVAPFEEAAFSLAEGEISEVVKTRFGFHIIKVEEIQAAQTKPLAQVRDEIVTRLRQQEAKSLALEKANEAYEQIILAGSLEKYAEKTGKALKETGYFSRKSPPEALADNQEFLEAAFNLQKGELSSLISGAKGYAVIFVEDAKEPEIPALAAVQEAVAKDYVAERSLALAKEAAQQLLADLKAGAAFAEKVQELGLTLQETGFVSRRQPAAEGKLPPAVLQTGFGLSAAKPYPESVAESDRTFYVLRFQAKQAPSADLFAKNKEEIKNRLLQQDQMMLLAGWLDNLRREAEITRNERILL